MKCFAPDSNSVIEKFVSWFTGRRPEFADLNVLSGKDSREGKNENN